MAVPAERTSGDSEVLLSIVVPFYNSARKSERLLSTLGKLQAHDVEVVCVDDGSSDATLHRLNVFRNDAAAPVLVLSQDNRGPGGARNTGLRAARGKYIWFVDSDDDINLDAIEILRDARSDDFDFIDFNFNIGARNAMMLPAGTHVVSSGERANLITNFGSLVTKIFSKRFMAASEYAYPEYCYYEDNALGFTLAMNTRRFLKSEQELYEVHVDFESATRGTISPRFYDRLHTAEEGAAQALPLAASESEREAIAERFRDLFVRNTCRQIFRSMTPKVGMVAAAKAGDWANVALQGSARLNPLPWVRTSLLCARVMRHYRRVAENLGIGGRLRHGGGNFRLRGFLKFSWLLSRLLPDQERYFAAVRATAWEAADDSPETSACSGAPNLSDLAREASDD